MTCRLTGKFVTLQADTITLAMAESTASYGLDAIDALEVSRGHRSYWIAGSIGGAVVGAVVAHFVLLTGGSSSLCDHEVNQDALSSDECLGLAGIGAIAGAVVGGVIGGLIRTEKWQDVPIENLRVNLAPQPDGRLGMAVAVGVAFR